MDKKRILIVEDETVTAMDLKSSLIELGYEVPAIAASGEDAVRRATELLPDLILMDITLSGSMSGIQAAEEIRKTHAIPFVFLTAHADMDTIGRAKTTEPFGYLPKPSTMDTLMSTIEVALYKGEADAQRRKAEARLKWVRDEQKVILDNIGVGVLFTIYRKIIWANKSLAAMMGYSIQEMISKDVEIFYPDKQSYDRIGREGYPVIARGETYKENIQMKRMDGSLFWCHLVAQAVNPANHDEGSIWMLEDVTKSRQMEEDLRRSEEKYRTVANFTHDWEFWIAPDDRLLYTSPSCERVTGYSAEKFEREPSLLRRLIHPDDIAAYHNHRHAAKAGTGERELEFRITRADGLIRWISHVCQPVHDEQGQFLGTRGSNRDITKRKTAELDRERVILELQETRTKVKILSGMLPICSSCKKIRDDKGYWQQIESYVHDHSDAEFTHGICPDCAKRIYGAFYKPENDTKDK